VKKIRGFVAATLILIAYFICRLATWVDSSKKPEGGWTGEE
jgi:hypothetical protein